LDSGANPDLTNNLGQTPLHLAASNENAFSIRTLVKYNANVNCFDINGNTPLHEIIKAHNKNSKSNNSNLVSIAQFLVSNGADLNAKNMVRFQGSTDLHIGPDGRFTATLWHSIDF
jgi:ankyrin repeat protein